MQARAWHVPLGYLSYGMTLRAIVGTMITTLLSGVIAFGCFGLAPESLVQSISYEPALVGAGTAIALLYIQLRRTPLLRGAALLVGRSREAEIREDCLNRLETLVAYSAKRSAGRAHAHARLTLFVVPVLSASSAWNTLRTALMAIELDGLSNAERAITLQARASVHIHLGEANDAAEAISLAERPAGDPKVESWLTAIEALVMSVGDTPERALEIIGHSNSVKDPSLLASHQIIRAHVFASQGKADKARAMLTRVLKDAGEEALKRAILPAGPATELATKMLSSNR